MTGGFSLAPPMIQESNTAAIATSDLRMSRLPMRDSTPGFRVLDSAASSGVFRCPISNSRVVDYRKLRLESTVLLFLVPRVPEEFYRSQGHHSALDTLLGKNIRW